MKVIHEYPPNFSLIKIALPAANGTHTYCYGETIFCPDGHELSPDIIFHESIHAKQQGNDPQTWWNRYLTDPSFRLTQEIEAYGKQYLYAKERIEKASEDAVKKGERLFAGKHKMLKWALEKMAYALSGGAYGNILSYGEAESRIRNYGR